MKPTRYDDDGPKQKRRGAKYASCSPVRMKDGAMAVIVFLETVLLSVISGAQNSSRSRTDRIDFRPGLSRSKYGPMT